LPVLAISNLRSGERRPGRPSVAGGRAAYSAILDAFHLIRIGFADALVTAPICKANLVAAGADVPGHTELLANLSGGVDVVMMMVGKTLRVALATTHMAISRVPKSLSVPLVLKTITITNEALRQHYRIVKPRIAVTGLNPHAGEEGLFGNEEQRVIEPAIRKAKQAGIRASGPFPADGLFPHAAAGEYDAVVCMYHDQGLAPFKLRHFADGVNFTAGLPFIRTSPDHGTAHDIAGRGDADPGSMIAALSLAAELCRKKQRSPRQTAG
jgi:4-hydroxythreonine-4-phosphate dehydrogenase